MTNEVNAPEYAVGGANRCLICHGERSNIPAAGILTTAHALRANPRAPFAEGNHDCQSCHGPSAAHLQVSADGVRPPPAITFTEQTPVRDRNTQCLGCHQSDVALHWAGSRHQFEELACSDCHRLHTSTDPVRQPATQSQICFDCHAKQRADFFRASVHPVREGLLTCVDCHDAHGGAGPALLSQATVNDTCYQCHSEKRGPFLWEHAPVQENCANCHTPHGSNHRNLLQARAPWMCQQCHLAQFHPSTALSGNGVPPLGASTSVVGKNCMNCHNAVHGSNHPSGARLIR